MRPRTTRRGPGTPPAAGRRPRAAPGGSSGRSPSRCGGRGSRAKGSPRAAPGPRPARLRCSRGCRASAGTVVTVVPALESEAPGGSDNGIVLTPDMPLRIAVSVFNGSDEVLTLPLGWQRWLDVSVASSCTGVPAVDARTREGEAALTSFLALHPASVNVAFDEPDAVREIRPGHEYTTTLSVAFEAIGPFVVLVDCHPPVDGGTAAGFSPFVLRHGEREAAICGQVVAALTDLQRARRARWEGAQANTRGGMIAAVGKYSEAHALIPSSMRLELELAWMLDRAGDAAGAARHYRHALSQYGATGQDPFVTLEDGVFVEHARRRVRAIDEAESGVRR